MKQFLLAAALIAAPVAAFTAFQMYLAPVRATAAARAASLGNLSGLNLGLASPRPR